jgi:hypothetical protein
MFKINFKQNARSVPSLVVQLFNTLLTLVLHLLLFL